MVHLTDKVTIGQKQDTIYNLLNGTTLSDLLLGFQGHNIV